MSTSILYFNTSFPPSFCDETFAVFWAGVEIARLPEESLMLVGKAIPDQSSMEGDLEGVPFVNCRQFMYLVISLLVLRAGYGIWLYQFLIFLLWRTSSHGAIRSLPPSELCRLFNYELFQIFVFYASDFLQNSLPPQYHLKTTTTKTNKQTKQNKTKQTMSKNQKSDFLISSVQRA